MPYLDRLNRVCGFLDIEEKENSSRFGRRYFILDTTGNVLLWYMDNPQNLPSGASFVGSLKLTYISKVSEATLKQKPKTQFCFVINAVSRQYFVQANDATDMKEWVASLNKASKITEATLEALFHFPYFNVLGAFTALWTSVPKTGQVAPKSDVSTVISNTQVAGRRQQAYKTEIIGGVVVNTPIQNDAEEAELKEKKVDKPGVLRRGYCVKQGGVRKSWKRRYFTLDENAVSYYKSEMDKEPLRAILLRDIQKVHECLVKSGDLLMRDNLFEIITNSRIFYIQTDTPEEMYGWIREIQMKIQGFRGPTKAVNRVSSLYRSHHAHHGDDRRPPLMKSCSVAPGWQPWTPVPPRESPALTSESVDNTFSSLPTLPCRSSCSSTSSSSSSSTSLSTPTLCASTLPPASPGSPGVFRASRISSSGRRRHRSHPQPSSACSLPYSLDDDSLRTTDV